MDTNLLDSKFARIGARLKVADHPSRRSRTAGVVSLDVQADRKGEFFEIVRQPGAEAEIAVLDVQPKNLSVQLPPASGDFCTAARTCPGLDASSLLNTLSTILQQAACTSSICPFPPKRLPL